MSAGDIAAWAAVCATIVIAAIGGTTKIMQRRADRIAKSHERQFAERDRQIAERDRKIELLEQAADKQDDVIADLRSQRDKLQITAELQDKFFGGLGKLPPNRRERD
jgi:hypothetical protein